LLQAQVPAMFVIGAHEECRYLAEMPFAEVGGQGNAAREWEPAFSPAACTRLLSVLRGGDAFCQEAVRALDDAGADLAELGRFLDVAEFLHVLPRRVLDGLRSAALAPDSELRDLVDALLRLWGSKTRLLVLTRPFKAARRR
jgi:hypothetical protein